MARRTIEQLEADKQKKFLTSLPYGGMAEKHLHKVMLHFPTPLRKNNYILCYRHKAFSLRKWIDSKGAFSQHLPDMALSELDNTTFKII